MESSSRYQLRLNRTLDYIRQNINAPLALDDLSQIAGFSSFHFHRIFKALTGETVNQAIVRLRLERAIALLKASPAQTYTQIAFSCGFNSSSNFSRTFKKYYGISPQRWDKKTPLNNSKNGQVLEGFPRYNVEALQELEEQNDFEVCLRFLPEQKVGMLRVTNSYQTERVLAGYRRLLEWYTKQGGDLSQAILYGMSQDDPTVTPLELCSYDFCLSVADGYEPDDDVALTVLPACKIAYIRCKGDIFQIDKVWQYLYRYWLPRSGYLPANLPALEIFSHPALSPSWDYFEQECAIPVMEDNFLWI